MNLRFVVASIFALSTAVSAAAPAQTAAVVVDPLYRLDQYARVRVEVIRDSARALGLPEAPIVNKALEGRQKKKDAKEIVRAVSRLFTDMRVAQKALDTNDPSEIEAGASALLAGVTPEELTKFRSTTRGRSPLTTLTLMTDMIVRLGVLQDKAVSNFVQFWQGGYSDAEIKGLWTQVSQDILSGGANPVASLQLRARQLPPRVPRSPDE